MNLENTRTLRDLLRNANEQYADRSMIQFEYDSHIIDTTYADFTAYAERVGAWAEEKAKEKGRKLHIATFGSPSRWLLTTIFGTVISGNVVVPLDVQLGLDALADTMDRADVDYVFYDVKVG